MKIAVASCGLGHVSRGIEAWAADLGAALKHRGEQVTLFQGGGLDDPPYLRTLKCWQRDRSIVNARWFPKRWLWRFGYGSPYMAEQTTFAKILIREFRYMHYDILHVQDPHVALRVQQANTGVKVILAHGTEEPPEFLMKLDYVQHLAPWHLEAAKQAGAWKPAWTAIPNFIDTAKFAPGPSNLRKELNIPDAAFVVLTAAAIKRHHKRIDYLLEECAKLQDAYLIVAGGWEGETEELIAMGQRLLGNRVRFLVKFPRERMPELYRTADAFALASLFEMMPIALVEACASGLPCIVNDHEVMRWMTGPGGVPIPMATTGALAKAIRELMADASRRKAMGDAARKHCVAHFGTDAVVDRIVEYYGSIA